MVSSPHTPSEGGGGINVKSLQDIYCQSKSISLLQGRQMMVQWAEGHIKWKQLFSASSDPILPQWEGLLWKWAMMACHRRLAFIIYLGVQCTEAQWLKTHIESPHVAGPQPNPSPPPKALGKNITREFNVRLNQLCKGWKWSGLEVETCAAALHTWLFNNQGCIRTTLFSFNHIFYKDAYTDKQTDSLTRAHKHTLTSFPPTGRGLIVL